MIHQAARAMALEHLGESAWADILNASGLDEAHFVSAQTYPDEQTLALVGAVAERAHLSLEDALRAFGRYWIKFTEKSSYSSLMGMSGDNMQEFLANLNRMHGAIQAAMPDARMPSFPRHSIDCGADRRRVFLGPRRT
ncbi:MAG: heme NO-binding domain-containing protein [Caulobacteraceae bacterium]